MHVVILGCGRVGSAVAHTLEAQGHSVAVIDQDQEAFRRLHQDFTGRRVVGVGFDRDTLQEAGIQEADAFAAISSGDNSNILAARVARETFGVSIVVARIYDPRRAEVYERLGIPTVATVRWTADQMVRRLVPVGAQISWVHPSGSLVLAQIGIHPSWAGHSLRELSGAAGVRVACLTRRGEGLLPGRDSVVQEGDLVHVTVPQDRLEGAQKILGGDPGLLR